MKIIYTLLGMVLAGLFWDADLHVIRGLLNLLPAFIWFVFLLLVANSWFISTMAVSCIVAALYLLSAVKLEVWRQPITPADLHYLRNLSDLWDVLKVYTEPYVLIALVISFVALIVLVYRRKIDRKRDRFLRYTRDARGLVKRLLVMTIGLIALAVWIHQLVDFRSPMHRIYHDFSTKHGVSRLKTSLKENGFFTYFISQLPLFEIQMPCFDKTMTPVQPIPFLTEKRTGASVLPDILVWVNESTFDPQYLNLDCPGMPSFKMFQEHPANIASGLLNVPAFGGRTWMTEFGFFAGIPPLVFGRGGTCAPYTLAPKLKESLGTHLRSRGYRTVALNPVSGRFMNTASTYEHYGMDEFHDPKDLGYPDPGSWHIPDDFFKEQTIRYIEGHDGPMPLFLVVLTMGNHGPHGQDNRHETPYCLPAKLPRKKARQLNDYLERLKKTDMAVEALTGYVMTRRRPTIFLYFGDHLPAFTDDIPDELFDAERGVDKMKTTFHIRTNYPVKHPVIPHTLDISFLSGLLLDVAQLNDSPFFRFNSFMRNHANGKMPMQANSDPYMNSYFAQIVNQIKR
ncbi:MAG: LTA synthase family protein [Desulfobacteraceae bacterium]|nr:LTA synthase family protein [Desulfobacteraceae bacterium]